MINDSIKELTELLNEQMTDFSSFKKLWEAKEIPELYDAAFLNSPSAFLVRSTAIDMQGFSLLSHDWVKPLAEWIGKRSCLEIMSGCGSLTAVLKAYQVTIQATDNFSWNSSRFWNTFQHYWTDVECLDAIEAIQKYAHYDLVICSWPYMDDTAYRALLTMRQVNPNMQMIYIGEWTDGCTADSHFFDTLELVEDASFEAIKKRYPRWRGIYDNLYLIV